MASNPKPEMPLSPSAQPAVSSKSSEKAPAKAVPPQTTPQINPVSAYRMARGMQRLHRNAVRIAGAFDPLAADAAGDAYDDSDMDDSDDDDDYNESDNDDDNDNDNYSIRSAHSDDEEIHSDDEDHGDSSNAAADDGQNDAGAGADTADVQGAGAGSNHTASSGSRAPLLVTSALAALGSTTTRPTTTTTATQTSSAKPATTTAATTTAARAVPANTPKAAAPAAAPKTLPITATTPLKPTAAPIIGPTTAPKDAPASATETPSTSAVTTRPAAEKAVDPSVTKATTNKPKHHVAPPGYEIVRVKKPDGTIVRVQRPIRPVQKPEAPKLQNGEAQPKPAVQAAQPKAPQPKALDTPPKQGKVGTTVNETEKGEKTEVLKPQPSRAQKFVRHTSLATRIIIWTIMITLPLLFITLGILTAVINGQPISSSLGQGVTQANRVAVSIWPIAFAALAAQALRMYASYKVERGLRLMTLEQLISSHSVAGAIKQPFLLQTFNLTGLLLLCLWSLSPLAGQALLRMSYTDSDGGVHNISVQYLDTTIDSSAFAGASSSSTSTPIVNALFGSSILAPLAGQQAPMDTWGNIKIPILQSLNETDETGWAVVNSQPSYSSLVGVPVSGLQDDGSETSFIIHSAYFTFDCPALTNVTSELLDAKVNDTTGLLNWTSPGGTLRMGVVPSLTALQGLVLFASKYQDPVTSYYGWEYTLCKMNQSFVQSHISCTGKDCLVDKMHANVTNPNYVSPYELSDFTNWMAAFAAAGASSHPMSYTPTQFFLNDTTSAGKGDVLTGPNLQAVDPTAFNTRLALLLNTYWQAGVAPMDMTGAIETAAQGAPTPLTATALDTNTAQVYRASWGWLVVLLVSSVLLLVGGVGGAICDSRTLGPDIFGFASSLANRNKYIRVPTGDSSMGGAERARMLRNEMVMLQDVKPDDPVGKIALGSVSNGGARLKPGRVYR